jgi:hypothetical protein
MVPNPKDEKWYSLAEQASTEMDPTKLMLLVNQLCAALDERTNSQAVKPGREDLPEKCTAMNSNDENSKTAHAISGEVSTRGAFGDEKSSICDIMPCQLDKTEPQEPRGTET